MHSRVPGLGPPLLLGLRCAGCSRTFGADHTISTCGSCGSLLSCFYDYEKTRERFTTSVVAGRDKNLWRYWEVLPVLDPGHVCSLGEGFTPLLRLKNGVLMKDDGQIPTGTFKARGMAVAVSKAKELGLKKLAVPSAGNAGAALACTLTCRR